MRWFGLIVSMVFLSACWDNQEEKDLQGAGEIERLAKISPELAREKLASAHALKMAQMRTEKALAEINGTNKEALGKMDQTVRLKALELEHLRNLEAMKHQSSEADKERTFAHLRNVTILAAILFLVIAYGIFVLLKRRYDNKLQAYNDNLQKYFYHRENDTRLRIAEKIVDTIAEGKSEKIQEQKLIEILHGVKGGDDDDVDRIEMR